jgi:hypothetical protein
MSFGSQIIMENAANGSGYLLQGAEFPALEGCGCTIFGPTTYKTGEASRYGKGSILNPPRPSDSRAATFDSISTFQTLS